MSLAGISIGLAKVRIGKLGFIQVYILKNFNKISIQKYIFSKSWNLQLYKNIFFPIPILRLIFSNQTYVTPVLPILTLARPVEVPARLTSCYIIAACYLVTFSIINMQLRCTHLSIAIVQRLSEEHRGLIIFIQFLSWHTIGYGGSVPK